MGQCTHLSFDRLCRKPSRPMDKDHPTNLKRIGSQVVSKDSPEVTGSVEDFLTMAVLTFRHICLSSC